MLVSIETDPKVVQRTAAYLTGAFNRYLKAHPHLPMPDTLLGLCHFYASVVSDQAERMELSPEQRDSYYRTTISLLMRLLHADLEQVMAMRFVAKTTPHKRP